MNDSANKFGWKGAALERDCSLHLWETSPHRYVDEETREELTNAWRDAEKGGEQKDGSLDKHSECNDEGEKKGKVRKGDIGEARRGGGGEESTHLPEPDDLFGGGIVLPVHRVCPPVLHVQLRHSRQQQLQDKGTTVKSTSPSGQQNDLHCFTLCQC